MNIAANTIKWWQNYTDECKKGCHHETHKIHENTLNICDDTQAVCPYFRVFCVFRGDNKKTENPFLHSSV